MMKVSIITVCYNSEKTIANTFDSIRNQTYSNIEYIVVDGNSKDSTLKLIKSNADIISKWVSEPDKGLYDAMNKGIQMATGDIIGILNSDDTLLNENVISNVVKFHESHNIDASIGNIIQHNTKGKTKRVYSSKKWNPQKLKIGFMPPHPSIFIRKEIYDKHGLFKTDFEIGADYAIITRFFLNNNIEWKYSGITTTAMLIGGASSSGVKSYVQVTKDICHSLEDNQVPFSRLKIMFRFVWKLKDVLGMNRLDVYPK